MLSSHDITMLTGTMSHFLLQYKSSHNSDIKGYCIFYSTLYGMYEPNCGLEHVTMSFGHDEYMYRVLVGNGTTLPEPALYMVRYHSFYPWHTGGDYNYLCNDKDLQMLEWIREFK